MIDRRRAIRCLPGNIYGGTKRATVDPVGAASRPGDAYFEVKYCADVDWLGIPAKPNPESERHSGMIPNTLGAKGRYSGASVSDAPKLAYGLLYRFVGGQAVTLAYIDVFIVLTTAASIMFLLSFIVRKDDPKAGGVAVG